MAATVSTMVLVQEDLNGTAWIEGKASRADGQVETKQMAVEYLVGKVVTVKETTVVSTTLGEPHSRGSSHHRPGGRDHRRDGEVGVGGGRRDGRADGPAADGVAEGDRNVADGAVAGVGAEGAVGAGRTSEDVGDVESGNPSHGDRSGPRKGGGDVRVRLRDDCDDSRVRGSYGQTWSGDDCRVRADGNILLISRSPVQASCSGSAKELVRTRNEPVEDTLYQRQHDGVRPSTANGGRSVVDETLAEVRSGDEVGREESTEILREHGTVGG
ncbi:hypothetical protein FIBSPDRAFT_885514 [Athelia psychrophila]|uniref:Uncharacterized protein n=1 Tax=Athelia psychrophila TaxID=1759441 RepID=A0A166RU66_9AGAM|nr:hypothetical protein FIBSPDRAFT_885514 [Fibularhizoctonia sp. CBS 109695]